MVYVAYYVIMCYDFSLKNILDKLSGCIFITVKKVGGGTNLFIFLLQVLLLTAGASIDCEVAITLQ